MSVPLIVNVVDINSKLLNKKKVPRKVITKKVQHRLNFATVENFQLYLTLETPSIKSSEINIS